MTEFFKRITLAVFVFSTLFSYSQNSTDAPKEKSRFKEDYNTWAIGAGFSILNMHGDLRSFDTYSEDAYVNLGGYIYADKMFNPIVGMEVKFNVSQLGGEVQKIYNSGDSGLYYRILYASKYNSEILTMDGISYGFETNIILNIDNLWKRHSKKWSFSSYFGAGYQKYDSRLIIKDYDASLGKYPLTDVAEDGTIKDADFGENFSRDFKSNAGSLYLNMGLGVKYRLNDKFDIEARGVINLNHEDHLDAAISQKQVYESYFTGNIGVVYKIGKKKRYAIWVQDEVFEPFKHVDFDDDGVPDDLDKELNTPRDAEVYGSGIAIDSDKDGLKDYEDDCPLVPGPIDNRGCPIEPVVVYEEAPEEVIVEAPVVEFKEEEKQEIVDKISLLSKAIYFKTASDQLKEESYKPLNEISDIMFEYPDSKFKIEGHTDSRGNDNYNLDLSKRRSKSVYTYLSKHGISSDRLSSKGFGEVNPIATNDTEAGRQMNRRVEINFIDPDSEEGKLVYDQGVVIKKTNNRRVGASYSSGGMVPAADSDGDGVPDVYDKEPHTPKESKVYGDGVSVDSDRDGVPDYRDDCPFAKGTVENSGCPGAGQQVNTTTYSPSVVLPSEQDLDGDGVANDLDKEPNTPSGVKVYANGVSYDTDKDGVPDHEDKCPFSNGNIKNGGCPLGKDSDNDGVVDSRDRCPTEKGSTTNFGCPVVKSLEAIEMELKGLANKMKFARSEGHVLKSNNILVLEKMGMILNEYEAISIRIEVHTNNKPNLKYNLDLSQRRAFAIRKYLTQVSGISSSRIDAAGLGGTKPAYDTEVKEENSKNNRVELYLN